MPKLALKELVPHGTTNFALRVHEFTSDPHMIDRVPLHWHPECELLVVTKGAAILHLNGGQYHIGAGDIGLIMPDQVHAFTAPLGRPFEFYAVVFDPIFLRSASMDLIQRQYLTPIMQQKLVLPAVVDDSVVGHIRANLDSIRQADAVKYPGFELEVKAQLYLLWAKLVTLAVPAPSHDQRGMAQLQLIKAVIGTIQVQYPQPLSLAGLAEQFNVSKGHLCHVFKATTHETVSDYLNETRIQAARKLLKTSSLEIGDVATQVGFNNISYFNRRFLKATQLTPSAYRRQFE